MRWGLLAMTIVALLAPLASHAEESKRGFSGSLGSGVGWVPEYEGAEDSRSVPIFLMEFEMHTGIGRFALGQEGLSWTPIESERMRAGIFAAYDTGRTDRDERHEYRAGSAYLQGMGEIGETPETGAFIGWNFGGVETLLQASDSKKLATRTTQFERVRVASFTRPPDSFSSPTTQSLRPARPCR